ncbi:hypothetical protein [Halosegnis marinus]|uniref:DUF8159 domain-containing protein n=1 Tax=Halosegnis marinus TaxID=3034023 RepID=A0ABD5ZLF6_9EURY|nr:hypothetical protein [Halosegnis sp. DT85]
MRTRRRLLAAAGTVALAGCSGGDAPDDRFRDRLTGAGVGIRALSVTSGAWVLEYLTTATSPEELRAGARTVALAYAATVPGGDHRLDATAIADAEGAVGAEWAARGSWARANADGDLSADDYVERIAADTDDF